MNPFLVFLAIVLLALLRHQWRRRVLLQRLEYIRKFELPSGLFERLRKRRAALTLKDCQLVAHALRQFFLAYAHGGGRFIAMPSQVTDELWHEFILYTSNYERFCRMAFGGFFHHAPAVALGSDRKLNAGLRRCWWQTCKEENTNPRRPTRLPRLFAIDAKLGIADGFRYAIADSALARVAGAGRAELVYRAEDFSDASIDGTTEGFGDSGGSDGGCGGGGCGGGGD